MQTLSFYIIYLKENDKCDLDVCFFPVNK